MKYLRISNWDKWQSYRKDRGQPPWIKVHRRVMRNPEWVMLSDAERGQLVSLWLLAADHDGDIPASPEILQKLCFMSDPPNLNKFIELGFIESNGKPHDANTTPERRQDVTPKAEAKAEAEENREDSKESLSLKSGSGTCPHQKIIDLYHETLPELPTIKNWPEHLQKILRTRWKEDTERQSLEWWGLFFQYIRGSPFLMGKKTEFQADLEWLVRPRNFTKIANGRYHRDKNSAVGSKASRTIENLKQWMQETGGV